MEGLANASRLKKTHACPIESCAANALSSVGGILHRALNGLTSILTALAETNQITHSAQETGTTGASVLRPYSVVGTLSLDGAGNFSITEWVSNSGSVTPQTYFGTYAINPTTCALSLNYSSTQNTGGSSGGSTGSFVPPPGISGLVGTSGGIITASPSSGVTIPGEIIPTSGFTPTGGATPGQ